MKTEQEIAARAAEYCTDIGSSKTGPVYSAYIKGAKDMLNQWVSVDVLKSTIAEIERVQKLPYNVNSPDRYSAFSYVLTSLNALLPEAPVIEKGESFEASDYLPGGHPAI